MLGRQWTCLRVSVARERLPLTLAPTHALWIMRRGKLRPDILIIEGLSPVKHQIRKQSQKYWKYSENCIFKWDLYTLKAKVWGAVTACHKAVSSILHAWQEEENTLKCVQTYRTYKFGYKLGISVNSSTQLNTLEYNLQISNIKFSPNIEI